MGEITKASPKAEIEAFQLALEELDFPLPRFGADGYWGTELKGAAHDAADKYDLPKPKSDVIPAKLVDTILRLASPGVLPPMPESMVDISSWAHPGPRVRRVPVTFYKGVTFHTSGCTYLGSYTNEEMHRRLAQFTYKNSNGKIVTSSLKAHVIITRSTPSRKAQIVLVHPIDWFVWHGNLLSETEFGLEIESFCYGELGNPKSLPSGNYAVHEAQDEQIELAKVFLRWKHDTLIALRGYGLTTGHPHRFAKKTRRGDCGQRIYQELALWAEQEFGLDTGEPGSKMGSGLPTPDSWTGQKNGILY